MNQMIGNTETGCFSKYSDFTFCGTVSRFRANKTISSIKEIWSKQYRIEEENQIMFPLKPMERFNRSDRGKLESFEPDESCNIAAFPYDWLYYLIDRI